MILQLIFKLKEEPENNLTLLFPLPILNISDNKTVK